MPVEEQIHGLLEAARKLDERVSALEFGDPVAFVYNPLQYAWRGHAAYLRRFGAGEGRRVVFLGMNPGPWGMAQTGVPFGEISAVRDWLGIEEEIDRPDLEHPKRPIQGFACTRSEVSGKRLWGLFSKRFESAERFFKRHFVANYCPLVFMSESGANITPNRISAAERMPLQAACDAHLALILTLLRAEWLIGVGQYAWKCGERVRETHNLDIKIGQMLHPSPASPVANKHWPERPTEELEALGVW